MEQKLNNEEINRLLERAKAGDNEAWESLYGQFERYIHKCAWKIIRKYEIFPGDAERQKEAEEDLFQAGWVGFGAALRKYDPAKGKFLTYVTDYIRGELCQQKYFLTSRKGLVYVDEWDSILELSESPDGEETDAIPARIREKLNKATDRGDYSTERRTLQIMEVLRMLTDENHSLSKAKLKKCLVAYRCGKYGNTTKTEADNTFKKTVAEILLEVDPECCTAETEADYRIKYEGYRENELRSKIKMSGEKVTYAPAIDGLSYVHPFDNGELDDLIQIVCLSELIPYEEKLTLVQKLLSTASIYYETPFWRNGGLAFRSGTVSGRHGYEKRDERSTLPENLQTIQQAIQTMARIKFRFCRYTAEHERTADDNEIHTLSPYHLVVYHDNYYCIGMKKNDKRIWHYRVDLMSDVELVYDPKSKKRSVMEVAPFEGLPIGNRSWNPEKYMAEHLYMGYDEPETIHVKIRNTDYTILHDWFGNHYKKIESGEDGYDIVKIETSPYMIIHWAMQYGDRVEILNDDIREKLRTEIEKLKKLYAK